MPGPKLRLATGAGGELAVGFARIRHELDVHDDFPSEAESEARQAARDPELPKLDRTDIPLITVDPPGSMDLDQALHLERRGQGYRFWYAIADVAAFVPAGGAVDSESHVRGKTIYLPDRKAPLHPRVLSEDAASLLPGQTRPAVLWRIDLDSNGDVVRADVRRALVRSTQRFDYAGVQRAVDTGTVDERLALFAEVGRLRLAAERARGGVNLPLPEQALVLDGTGWRLEFRGQLPAESWNAQLSLLTGMVAAQLMLQGGVGILRVLPDAPPERVAAARRVAKALDIPWPADAGFAQVVHGLDPTKSRHAAFLQESAVLLRGACYVGFRGQAPTHCAHVAVAAPYAHVTAPLRRLADRYATEACLAVAADAEVPEWVQRELGTLPEVMDEATRTEKAVERACLDFAEALLLRDRVGEVFQAVVVDVDEDRPGGQVQLRDPAIRARCDSGHLPLGESVAVRLAEADPGERRVRFSLLS